jgi:RNA polymerase sigma-70 factor, ECF subfamily
MFDQGPIHTIHDLVGRYYQSLLGYAYRLCGQMSEAEDLTQETFLLAQNRFSQLREAERARAWLFRILRNAYLLRLRDDKQRNWISIDSTAEIACNALNEDKFDLAPHQLQEALNDLPESYRTPLILFYFEDFTYREIADQMDLPLGTVMSRLARAKQFLRQRLTVPDASIQVTSRQGD